jgi:hypothetical protein
MADRWLAELYRCIHRLTRLVVNYSAKFSMLTTGSDHPFTRFGGSLRLQLPAWQHLTGG